MNQIKISLSTNNLDTLEKLLKKAKKESAQLQQTIEQIQNFKLEIKS